MARSKTFDLNSDHEEADFYKQNRKTVGDKWAEGSRETNLLRQGSDDGDKPVHHKLSSLVEDGQGYGDLGDSLKSQYWQPGPIKRVGDNARPTPTGYYDTHQSKAYSPSGKYGKPGGKGQRSGA